MEIALQYNDGYSETLFSFANNINTVDGGSHLSGFRSALTGVLNKYARDHGEQPRYLLLAGDSFDAVRAVKAAEAARGVPVMVLGMEIVRGDDPATSPKVF